MLDKVKNTIEKIEREQLISIEEIQKAKQVFEQYNHVILSQGSEKINVQIESDTSEDLVEIALQEDILFSRINGKAAEWGVKSLTALYFVVYSVTEDGLSEGLKYTREGMMKRVLEERKDKALKADYKVILAKNLYGEHTLINDKGKHYKVTLRDFEKRTGYINNIDWRTNKLGTTKHIMYLFNYLENNPRKTKHLKKKFPFIEIFTDPQNDYKISWYYPNTLKPEEETLLTKYFNDQKFIENNKLTTFFSFVKEANDFENIIIRPEVLEKIEDHFQQRELQQLQNRTQLDFSPIRAELYPYQKEGVEFAVFKKAVIVADEMGLGKTLQAISTAILKKKIFNFKKTLVICPASVKHQWKSEVLKFSDESAIVVEGFPHERNQIYRKDKSFFHIINYETVLRDLSAINKANYDFVILDEAQK